MLYAKYGPSFFNQIIMVETLKQKVLQLQDITPNEAVKLSEVSDKKALYEAADEIRLHFHGNRFDLCSITNAKSGKCPEDCKWCSQSAHHDTQIEEYEIVDEDLAVREAVNNGGQGVLKHSLVTSGHSVSNETLDRLIAIYKRIGKETSICLCASMGLISQKQLLRLKNEANVKYYHCNLETAPSFFSSLVSTHTLEDKVETIKLAQKAGLEVCSGGIIGLGESMEQRIELAILLRELNIKSIPINILQPIKGTPLQDMQPLSKEEILTTFAIFRFINPTAYLRFAGGRIQIKEFQNKALKAGINAAITGDYLTSSGANIQEDTKDFIYAGFKINK